jgi:YjjG family noncanonical pyrimidine nucleotidase
VIKLVLVDVDNTLLDFDEYVKYAMRTGFEKFGYKKYEDWMYDEFCVINKRFWTAYEQNELTYDQLLNNRWNTVFEKLGIVGDGVAFEKFFKGTLFNNAILIDGAINALKYLSGKYVVCTATNGPTLQQKNRLAISGIDKFMTFNFISEEMGVQKPKREFFELALDTVNRYLKERGEKEIDKSEVIMIGDSLSSDINGAKNSEMQTCFFDRHKDGKAPQNADFYLRDWSQIKRIL